jgi:uncharacterized membrane protein YkvA (DUF1232 family)
MTALWVAIAAGLAVLCIAVGIAAWLIWRRSDEEARSLVKRVMRLPLRDKARLAYRLARDARIPLPVRAIPPALILYLSMPLDLIPDFIPVLGHVDDLVIVLIGVGLLLRFAPRYVLEDQIGRLETCRRGRSEGDAAR